MVAPTVVLQAVGMAPVAGLDAGLAAGLDAWLASRLDAGEPGRAPVKAPELLGVPAVTARSREVSADFSERSRAYPRRRRKSRAVLVSSPVQPASARISSNVAVPRRANADRTFDITTSSPTSRQATFILLRFPNRPNSAMTAARTATAVPR